MAILVKQLIEVLQKYDQDREVMIHTLNGETVEVKGYFVQSNPTHTILTTQEFCSRLLKLREKNRRNE